MDPMDFQMDNTQPTQSTPNTAPGCQYHPPEPSSNLNPAASRFERQFDPVHPWQPYPGVNPQNRPPPRATPFSRWIAEDYAAPSWPAFGAQTVPQSPGQQTGSMDLPHGPNWNASQGYGPTSHAYSGSTARPSITADQNSGRISAQVPLTGVNSTQPSRPQNSRFTSSELEAASFVQNYTARWQQEDTQNISRDAARSARAGADEAAYSRAVTESRMNEFRTMDSLSGRHLTWDAGEDDDGDIEAEIRAHNSEIHFAASGERARAIAAWRGQPTTSKKVPTKEALASLKAVGLEELEERDCPICYNEMGVCNPEGVVETPLRLPNCKHTFGDKCIKIWFEDHDSCPCCRDTLPSESPRRRQLAYETYRAVLSAARDREAAIVAVTQNHPNPNHRHGFPPHRHPLSGDFDRRNPPSQRTQDDYGLGTGTGTGSANMWPRSPIHVSPGDLPAERRRQARGRIGSNRAPHPSGRPTSGGSRLFIPHANQNISPRAQIIANPSIFGSASTTHRSNPPGLTRQASSGSGSTTASDHTSSRNRTFASTEEVSPPIADGISRRRNIFAGISAGDDPWDDDSIALESPSQLDGSGPSPALRSAIQRNRASPWQSLSVASPPVPYDDLRDQAEPDYSRTRDDTFGNMMDGHPQSRWSR